MIQMDTETHIHDSNPAPTASTLVGSSNAGQSIILQFGRSPMTIVAAIGQHAFQWKRLARPASAD
jgi:hypothetical protein